MTKKTKKDAGTIQGPHQRLDQKKSVFECRSAKTISKAPDNTGKTNNSIVAVINSDQENNGSVFKVKEYDLIFKIVT